MVRTFTAELSPSSLKKLAKDLRAYGDSLESKKFKYLERMAQEGEAEAQAALDALGPYPYGVGDLRASIVGTVTKPTQAKVLAGTDHAAFVEFGTGVKGANAAKDPNQPAGWVQDASGHGETGWFYPGDDGQRHLTQGMPARPFMTNAANALRRKSIPIAKEVFGS